MGRRPWPDAYGVNDLQPKNGCTTCYGSAVTDREVFMYKTADVGFKRYRLDSERCYPPVEFSAAASF